MSIKFSHTKESLLHELIAMENIDPTKKITAPADIVPSVWEYAEKEGKGNVLWPFRVALSGRDKSPDPIALACVLGKDESLLRVQNASNLIG